MGSWFAAIAVLFFCVSAVQAAEDARFSHPLDKDHPAGFSPHFADRAAWEHRAEFLRRQVLVSQGLWPEPVKTPINAVIHGAMDRGSYTVEKVFFASLPGHYVTGNLYRPKGRTGKVPVILCPYGHWPDGRFIWNDDQKIQKEIESGGEKAPDSARSPLQARCAMLASMGCVVFHYDLIGYCDSKKIEHRKGFTDVDEVLRLQSFAGLQTWNSIRAVDFVLSLPEADATRVGVTGASGGATQAILLGAVDPRVSATFPVVMVSMNMQGGCVCENAPLLRVGTNNVELATLFAPRPQGVAAAKDWTHDFETHGLPEMKTIYRLLGAENSVEGKFFPFPHNYNLHSREMMYDFMNRQLKLSLPAPVTENPHAPIPPADLSVYDAAHPTPADVADAATIRAWLTRTSDEQQKALSAEPEKYRAMLLGALQAMVIDALPTALDVEIISSSGPSPIAAGGGTWSGIIARKDTGERVPCKTIFPAKWTGDVVLWSHPLGCSSLKSGDPAVASALASGSAVVAIDLFMAGDFVPSAESANRPPNKESSLNPPYPGGFVLGYNRGVIANRVHDLLTATAMVRSWPGVRSVKLIGMGDAGPSALLARVLAGETIASAAIDLNGFDFDRVKDDSDPMLLPGALKYGGMRAFASLANAGSTLICNPPPGMAAPQEAHDAKAEAQTLIEWLLK